ncbi:DNA damage-inducible protein, putative [Entamoeba invadens IP1]|uniref:DNA damage-inducible protein, putative n=1 Tax=Entamoeba invadens IP1 TaxID=370355 RepID=A0A0A1UCM7_ENTIV|nr:DNA damage-inducible protein, putative [Entamoeba invadens IP1]ELP93668.1 DNA damage-inducible protein, putative [Entamoeba invadens IP1]|eukprot:XP_004260439.1 DNA damage-inducible protein, putative [Entamoeba invadens IP1]
MIDSGAQESVLSMKTARECNLLNQIDYQRKKMYQGMGQASSVGTIYIVPLIIGTTYCVTSLNVLSEDSPLDHLLIGTNTLRSLGCCIDFSKNCLRVKGEEVPFLTNTEVDYILHKPFHINPFEGEFVASQHKFLKPERPVLPTPTLLRYPDLMVQQLIMEGLSDDDALNMLDITGGNLSEALRKLH